MMSPPIPIFTPLTLVASFLVVASLWIAKSLATRSWAKLPPGPPGIPLIGNAFQMPNHAQWAYYTELSKKYGDITYLSAFGQPIVVLSSFAANTGLLVQKASISSGRPYLTMVMDIVGWSTSFIFLDTNPVWKAQRKLIHQYLGLPAMPLYHSMLESNSYGLVHRLVMGERDFTTEVTYTIAKVIMRMAYGVKIDSPDHIISRLSREASQHLEYSVELANFPIVNLFPILRFIPTWFPFADFQRIGTAWREQLLTSVNMPFDMVKADMVAGTAEPNFCTRSFENRPTGITDDDIKWASGSLYVASANTTMSTMETFVTAMIVHREVQAKSQAEIDRVIGPDRLPTLADREQLPYLDCIFKEVLRWHPAVPQGVAHRTTKASEYEGWFIPEDTIIIPNTWAISRDPKTYQSADDFVPERFEENPDLLDPRAYAFGFGRRICAGQAFAEQSIWMMMATLLATVNMRPALDENGAEIEINQEFKGTGRAISVSLPFRFEPRSPSLMALLRESPEAQDDLKA